MKKELQVRLSAIVCFLNLSPGLEAIITNTFASIFVIP